MPEWNRYDTSSEDKHNNHTWYASQHFHKTDRSKNHRTDSRPLSKRTFVPSNNRNHMVDGNRVPHRSRTNRSTAHCFRINYRSKKCSTFYGYCVLFILKYAYERRRRPALDLHICVDSRMPRLGTCLLYTSPSPRDGLLSRMPSYA